MTDYRHNESFTFLQKLRPWTANFRLGQNDARPRGSVDSETQQTAISAEASPPFEPILPDELEESREADWPRRDDEAPTSDPRKPR